MKRIDVMRWLLAVAMILMTATAVAQTLTVTGPSESLAGDLVVLTIDAESSTDTPPAWSVTPPEILDGKYRICDDGKTVVFASRLPGTYYFTAAANIGGKLEIDAASTLTVEQIGQAYKNIGLGLQASGFGRQVSGTPCETGNCPR